MTYRKRDYFAIAVIILGLVSQFAFYKTHIRELIHVAKWDNLYFYRAATESIEGFLLVLLFFLQFLILACMLFALIMAIARKPRVALWFNWITVFVWVGTVFLWMIYFTLTGHTGYFGPARIFIRVISGQLYTGNAIFNAYQNCKFFPLAYGHYSDSPLATTKTPRSISFWREVPSGMIFIFFVRQNGSVL